MTFYDVFEHLCAEKGVTPTQAGRDNGIAQGVISMWKKRGSTPKAQTVQKLANYFNVPIALFFNFNDLNTMSETLDVLAKISPDAIITRLDNSANDDDAEIHIKLSKGKVEYDAHVEAHELIDRLNEIQFTTLDITDDVVTMAEKIIDMGILTQKSFDDCQHIGVAVINECDCIISWNFRHIVNIKTIRGVRAITNLEGYKVIEIWNPSVLLESEE